MSSTSENNDREPSFSLKKSERLSSKKIIDKLFTEGESFIQYPVKFVYLKTELPTVFCAQAGFTVSKKNFKRAVARNRIKRLLRESYRLNKHLVYDEPGNEQLAVFIIYIGKELPAFVDVESATKKGLKKMIRRLKSNKENTST